MQSEIERHVTDEHHDLLVFARAFFEGGEILAEFGRQIAQVGVQIIHVAVLGEELGRGLLPHSRNTGQVVRSISAKGREQRITIRLNAAAFEDSGLVVERGVRDAASVVEDLHVGVLYQLERVAVPGHDDHGDRLVAPPSRERGQHVVGFEVLHAEHGDVQHLTEVANQFELVLDLRRGLGPSALVVLDHHVAKRAARKVEGHGQRARILATHERQQHRRETVQGVGDESFGSRDVGRQSEEGSKGQRHAVQQHQGALVGRGFSQRTRPSGSEERCRACAFVRASPTAG